jgi:hypothetical protein
MSPCENENESMGMMNWLTKVLIATAALAAVALLAESGRGATADMQFATHAAMLFALPWTLSSSRIRPRWRLRVEPSSRRRVRATSTLHRVQGRGADATTG